MTNWKKVLVTPSTTVIKAIEVIDSGAMKIALVVDEHNRLLGTVSDGDIRRGLLRNISMQDAVSTIMNPNPTTVQVGTQREQVLELMSDKNLQQIPVIDPRGVLVDLQIISDLYTPSNFENWIVIMAGGLGSRLLPLTKTVPKPMIEVGGKPILETIIEHFSSQGFNKYYISVNYMADVIKSHFQDGSKLGVDIKYLDEDEKLGTAGALSLLPTKPDEPLLVMNGDLLTKIDCRHLLSFHQEHQADATMCVREYDLQVPYGVVNVDAYRLSSIEEKPVHKFFVNAGIYVLNPEILDFIEAKYCDMPNVFEKLLKSGKETAVFPIREYWLDLGRIEDLARANGEYDKVFEE